MPGKAGAFCVFRINADSVSSTLRGIMNPKANAYIAHYILPPPPPAYPASCFHKHCAADSTPLLAPRHTVLPCLSTPAQPSLSESLPRRFLSSIRRDPNIIISVFQFKVSHTGCGFIGGPADYQFRNPEYVEEIISACVTDPGGAF